MSVEGDSDFVFGVRYREYWEDLKNLSHTGVHVCGGWGGGG